MWNYFLILLCSDFIKNIIFSSFYSIEISRNWYIYKIKKIKLENKWKFGNWCCSDSSSNPISCQRICDALIPPCPSPEALSVLLGLAMAFLWRTFLTALWIVLLQGALQEMRLANLPALAEVQCKDTAMVSNLGHPKSCLKTTFWVSGRSKIDTQNHVEMSFSEFYFK